MENTIPKLFFSVALKYSHRTALSYKKEGAYLNLSYKKLAEKIEQLRNVLQGFGVLNGDKIAILSENRPEWAISDLAIMASGGIVVPLHSTFSSKVICNVLKHCQAKILFVSNIELLNKVLFNKESISYLEKIILFEKNSIDGQNIFLNKITTWETIFLNKTENNFDRQLLKSDDPCSIIYTSGTTGEPKGAILSHKNFLSNVEAVYKVVPITEKDVFLSFLPLSHVLERMAGHYMPLLHGAKIVYSEGIKHLSENMKEVKPTVMISVPRIFEKFHDVIWDKINSSSSVKQTIFKWALKQKMGSFKYKVVDILVFKKIRQAMGGRFRFIVSGGASLNKQVAKFFNKLGILILEGYGLTETSPVVAVNHINNHKFGTVGQIVSGTDVIISKEKEILVKGPNVFLGYYNNNKETQKCFNENNWFCTGDLGFLDEHGFLTVIGRKKEMLVTSGGKNVWPEQIENFLNNDKFISQSMVVGNKRRFISALIVPDWQELEIFFKGKNLPFQNHFNLVKTPEVIALFNERLETKINPELNDYEKIKKISLLPNEFSQIQEELTPTLKLRRHIIEKHHQNAIESMYIN